MDTRSFADGFVRPPGTTVFELARRSPFQLGTATVDPSMRTLTGPGGAVTLEPRVLQVLLTLVDASGSVVTREDFIARCWGGQVVGDDSLNRAIGEVRRSARIVAADSFTIETIPKTGYRLTVADNSNARTDAPTALHVSMSRRTVLVGTGLAAAAVSAIGWAGWSDSKRDASVSELMAQGEQALREGLPEGDRQGIGFLREAVARAPDSADAWGLLALALGTAMEQTPPDKRARVVADCETAARRALSLDPRQSNAHAALAVMLPLFGDWANVEQRLRAVLAIDSRNVAATAQLGMLMQATGQVGVALRLTTRAAALEPLSPTYQYRRAYQLWSAGQLMEADRVIDRATTLWPMHPSIWYARMLIFAMTGRAEAALKMLDEAVDMPYGFPAHTSSVWRTTLVALVSGTVDATAAADKANVAAATASSSAAVNAMLCLSRLGALDPFFTVADGYYLRRGPAIGAIDTIGLTPTGEQRHRKTMSLFVPSMAAVRADQRFATLVEGMGLAGYWRQTGVIPDYKRLPA